MFNSRTSRDIDMNFGPVKLNLTRETLLEYSDIIAFFPIYGQFAVIPKPDSRRMVFKTYIFINQKFKTEPTNLYCFE